MILNLAVAILALVGMLFLLRGRLFGLVIGFILFGNAANLLLFAISEPDLDSYPFFRAEQGVVADPLPQALILTAIVISFALLGYLIALIRKLMVEHEVRDVVEMLAEEEQS